tara:strand:- start:1328 stop:1933 length:606 start_codon:yes stop_codon:yes gene_type:complete
MDKNSNTWKELLAQAKEGERKVDDGVILRHLGVDKAMLQKIEDDATEAAKDDIKVQVRFLNTSTNEDPKHEYIDDSGMDVRADLETPITINPSEIKLIPTGLHFDLPESMEIQIRPRSGLAAKNGITVLNTPGTVDRGYSGEIKVILINLGKNKFSVAHGDRIAQAVISPVVTGRWCKLIKRDTLTTTQRGSSGFGSTGIK